MVDFTENPAFYNRKIPKEKLIEMGTTAYDQIWDITWTMSIKPGIRNVPAMLMQDSECGWKKLRFSG